MKYTEALEKRDQILKKIEEDIRDIEKMKKTFRKEIWSRIKKKKVEGQLSETKYQTVGIDSARGIKRYIASNFYAYVCVAFKEKVDNCLQEADFDVIGFVEEEVELVNRILEGLSMGAEILLAYRESRNVDLVFMDGSVSTFIIKLNSAATAANNFGGKLSTKLKCFYEEIIKAFVKLLSSGKVMFVPKSSQKDDFKRLVMENLPSYLGDEFGNRINSISDVRLAQVILEPLEYVKVDISPHPYNLHNPYREGEKEYESFSRLTKSLFDLANSPDVFYFRGVGGYAYRVENFAHHFPADLIAQYTFGKTFYLTAEADRRAKDYVKTLLKESFPLEEEIR